MPTVVGMGDAVPFLWIDGLGTKDIDEKTQESLPKKQHIAFTAESQSSIFWPPFIQPLIPLPRCLSQLASLLAP